MKLYIYDHCPYCVKARMIFGFKNVKVELVTLLNDDEALPIKMIGQKMVPILATENGDYMAESLDIINHIEQNYGAKILTEPKELDIGKIANWLIEIKEYSYKLAMPAWLLVSERKGFLGEFATKGSRAYFQHKKELYIGSFAAHRAEQASYIKEVNKLLVKLEDVLHNSESVCAKLSLMDIHLYAVIRSLSIIKDLEYGPKLTAYRKFMADFAKVELHDKIAI